MVDALQSLESRGRRAYEWARLRRALWGAAPVALVVGAAVAATTSLEATLAAGGVLLVSSVAALWRGQGFQRAFLPGLLAGVPPLVLALCAAHVSHGWLGAACTPVCLSACALGGLGGGLLVGRWARRTGAKRVQVVSAAGFGILTGTLGSSCVGWAGVALLAAAFVLAAVAWRLQPPEGRGGRR